MEKTTKRICVAGIGAIGGYLAAALCLQYGDAVSLLARGARAESLRAKGIRLHSDLLGAVTAPTAAVADNGAALGVQDIIFICVKNYSLDQVCAQLRPCVVPGTVLVPVMNGIEPGDRLRAIFPEAIVADGLIYCVIQAEPDYSISQLGSYVTPWVGSKDQDELHQQGARMAAQLLADAGLDSHYSPNIENEIWKKFILNCAFNTLTAQYLATTGQLREDPDRVADFRALLEEALLVARHSGLEFPEDTAETQLQHFLMKQAPGATSSLRRDVEAHRPCELDAFGGALLRKGKELGLELPVTRRCYEALLEKTGERARV